MFRFTFKMLGEGQTVLPARGMQEIPEQLARALPPTASGTAWRSRRSNVRAASASGVTTADGEQIAAEAVVIATDPATAAALLDREASRTSRSPASAPTSPSAAASTRTDDRAERQPMAPT